MCTNELTNGVLRTHRFFQSFSLSMPFFFGSFQQWRYSHAAAPRTNPPRCQRVNILKYVKVNILCQVSCSLINFSPWRDKYKDYLFANQDVCFDFFNQGATMCENAATPYPDGTSQTGTSYDPLTQLEHLTDLLCMFWCVFLLSLLVLQVKPEPMSMCGGLSEVKEADGDVQDICNTVSRNYMLYTTHIYWGLSFIYVNDLLRRWNNMWSRKQEKSLMFSLQRASRRRSWPAPTTS